MEFISYGIYLFLNVFIAGNVTTLQFQHYSIYTFIGKDNFKDYIRANNKAAIVPSWLPAILLLIINIILVFWRPSFLSVTQAIFSAILNTIGIVSGFIGQRKVQTVMEQKGYSEERISFLVSTNWIRTFCYMTTAVMAVVVIIIAVR